MTRMRLIERSRTAALIGVATLFCAGCATVDRADAQDRTAMLTAAGFQTRPADTPAQQAQLRSLPPLKLVAERLPGKTGSSGIGYVYADPNGCKCVYVGNAAAYQAYRQLASETQQADEREATAELIDDEEFNWGVWGPDSW